MTDQSQPVIMDLVSSPAFWFASALVGGAVNVAASYVFKFLNTIPGGRSGLNVISAAHALLAGLSCAILTSASPPKEFIDGIPLVRTLLLALVVGGAIGVLWLARISSRLAVGQLMTFAVIFTLALIWGHGTWIDAIPAYGPLAFFSSALVGLYAMAHNFLEKKKP